jgi:hypothetical protein
MDAMRAKLAGRNNMKNVCLIGSKSTWESYGLKKENIIHNSMLATPLNPPMSLPIPLILFHLISYRLKF